MAVTTSLTKSVSLSSLGEFDVSLSVGENSSFRECMGVDRLLELQRALKDEVGERVFEKSNLQSRLEEVSEGESEEAALAIEAWLAWIVGRDLLRRTLALRAFVDGSVDNDVISSASFLLMGAQAIPAKLSVGDRLVAKQPVRKDETVVWSWTADSWQKVSFRAEFFARGKDSQDESEQLVFPLPGHALPLSGNRVNVEQDDENKSWSADADGTVYLVWDMSSSPRRSRGSGPASRSRSLVPPTTTSAPEVGEVALKIAKCDSAAAAAARTAADEARELRSNHSFGEMLKAAPAEACGVQVVPVRPSVVALTEEEETLTGLHVRANLRKAVNRLGGGAQAADEYHQQKASPEESLRDALRQLAELEDVAASERARADRGAVAIEMERDRAEAERRAARVERDNLASALKAATDRTARAEARVASAVGALNALSEHELRDDDEEGDDEDDRAAYNPFLSVDPRADRAWTSIMCGDDDIDAAAARARRAAVRCASASSRSKAALERLEADNKKLTEEKRVLIAELRRLRSVADEKVAESQADADEARMVQRQFAALAKRLKDERKALARRLSNCTCGAAQGEVLDESPKKKKLVREQRAEEGPKPSGGDDRAIESRRATLEAKLQGCREYVCIHCLITFPFFTLCGHRRQSALEEILKQQPDNPNITTLKSKLDAAILK